MKKGFLTLLFLFSFHFFLFSQALSDFYTRAGGLYIFYSNITSSNIKNYNDFGGVSFDVTHYRQKEKGYCYDIKFQAIGDGITMLLGGVNNFEYKPYISSLFEGNFGLNLVGEDKFILFVGIKPKLEILSLNDYYNGETKDWVNNGGNVFIGPSIRVDKLLNNWIGIRVRSSLDYDVFALGSQDEQTHPISYSFNPEIFTLSGIYLGVDYNNAPTLNSYNTFQPVFSSRRFDVILGWRFQRIF